MVPPRIPDGVVQGKASEVLHQQTVGTKTLGNVLPVVTNGNVDVVGASDRHVGTTNHMYGT